jgi:hypothetical protein
MDERRSYRVVALVGLFAVAAGALSLSLPPKEYPDTGRVPPIFAAAAERLEVHTLSYGQTLGEVLDRASLDGAAQNGLLLAFREHESPRRLRAGTEIAFRWRGEELLRGVDITLNPDETVRLTRKGAGWESDVVRTPVYTDTVFASGAIDPTVR